MLLGILALAWSLESTTDSVVVRRLVTPQPNRIQIDKRRTVLASAALESAVLRLRNDGFDAAAEAIAAACDTSRKVFGYSITVFSGTARARSSSLTIARPHRPQRHLSSPKSAPMRGNSSGGASHERDIDDVHRPASQLNHVPDVDDRRNRNTRSSR